MIRGEWLECASLFGFGDAGAVVSNADYTAVPPFVSNATTPNIIILMDNSGSMSNRACESTSCGTLPTGATSTTTTFTNTTRYSGYFDPLQCYTYNTTDTRFESGTAKATVATACPNTEWDGNFINWATLRRFDAVKRAMSGGDCFVARAADGTCPASGTPALKTVRAQAAGVNDERADVTYSGGTGLNTYVGRIPSADRTGNPGTISIGMTLRRLRRCHIFASITTRVSTTIAVIPTALESTSSRSGMPPNQPV